MAFRAGKLIGAFEKRDADPSVHEEMLVALTRAPLLPLQELETCLLGI